MPTTRSSIPVPRSRAAPGRYLAEPARCFSKTPLTEAVLAAWLRAVLRDARQRNTSAKDAKIQVKSAKTHAKRTITTQKARAAKKLRVLQKKRGISSPAASSPKKKDQHAQKTGTIKVHAKLPPQYAGADLLIERAGSRRIIWEAALVMQDRSQNIDKFYFLSIYNASGTFVLFQHWGRTGSKGQVKVTEFSAAQDAKSNFEKIFAAKTSSKWRTAATGKVSAVPGKYAFLYKDYSTTAIAKQSQDAASCVWEYHLTRDPQGKPDGWYPYDGDAATMDTATNYMETFWGQWKTNQFLDIRFVESGQFTYKVDFQNMTQTNTTSNKARPIRRAQK